LIIGEIYGLSIINFVFVEGVINNDKDDDKSNDLISRLDSIEKK
tara:strand:+ start:712 stop:843 length:132 start_codon:yes stop_codon:yes gene_type:complete